MVIKNGKKKYTILQKSLKKLFMNYIDLLLLHQFYNEYIKKGSKAIGVSNFWPNRLVDICLYYKKKIND
jgi:2,5-diketo-D-gluconate reductase A